MLKKPTTIFFALSSLFSIALAETGRFVRKVSIEDKAEIAQVAKAIANCNKVVYSHLELDRTIYFNQKDDSLTTRSVYRPMNQQEIDQEIDRAKEQVLRDIKSGTDIFVCSSLDKDILYGCIFVEVGKRLSDLVECTKVYITPAGHMNFAGVLTSMILDVEIFYKKLSFTTIALQSRVSYSSCFLGAGYEQCTEQEALSMGFQAGRNVAKNIALISALLAAFSGFSAYHQMQEQNKLGSFVLGSISCLSALLSIGNIVYYANNAVYYKKLKNIAPIILKTI